MKWPCKGCTERQLGCHSTCPRYQEAKAKNDAIAAEQREQAKIVGDILDFKISAVRATKKRYERRK